MKKIIALLTVLFILGFASGPVMAGSGPAPNSGDGVSDCRDDPKICKISR